MALSFALHGLALATLVLIATSNGAPSEEPALVVELMRAAPAPSHGTEISIDLPTPDEPPPVDAAEIAPTKVDLPTPDEPSPVDTADLKPVEPQKSQPKPQPPTPVRPAAQRAAARAAVTQTASPPDTGVDQVTQAAAATAPSAIVFEHHPRFRAPPRPAAYPPRAIELGQQGETLVRVRLDPDGAAAEIVLWRGSGSDLLDRAALTAVRGWQFMPAMRNGHAVAAWVEIPVRFHLR